MHLLTCPSLRTPRLTPLLQAEPDGNGRAPFRGDAEVLQPEPDGDGGQPLRGDGSSSLYETVRIDK